MVRGEGRKNYQVDVGGSDPRGGNATPGGGQRQVAGGHLGRRETPLADARALHDPLGVEAQRTEIFVANDQLGHVASSGQHLHACQLAYWSATFVEQVRHLNRHFPDRLILERTQTRTGRH